MSRGLKSYDDLFGLNGETTDILDISIDNLYPFENHPFDIYTGKKKEDLRKSIKESGILNPIIVRYINSNEYEILSGHNRVDAAKSEGIDKVPCIVKNNISDKDALKIVLESNNQRNIGDMKPSERAKVIKAYYSIQDNSDLKDINQEIKTIDSEVSISSGRVSPLATKSYREVATQFEMSKDNIARYLKVDTLYQEIKNMLDEGIIGLRTAVNLSYLTKEHQHELVEIVNSRGLKLDTKKSAELREYEIRGMINSSNTLCDVINRIYTPTKKMQKNISIGVEIVGKYFRPDESKETIEDTISAALEMYFQNKE